MSAATCVEIGVCQDCLAENEAPSSKRPGEVGDVHPARRPRGGQLERGVRPRCVYLDPKA